MCAWPTSPISGAVLRELIWKQNPILLKKNTKLAKPWSAPTQRDAERAHEASKMQPEEKPDQSSGVIQTSPANPLGPLHPPCTEENPSEIARGVTHLCILPPSLSLSSGPHCLPAAVMPARICLDTTSSSYSTTCGRQTDRRSGREPCGRASPLQHFGDWV